MAMLVCSQAVSATIFLFDDPNAANYDGGTVQDLNTVSGSYDDSAQQFGWNATFNTDPTPVTAFWLVVSGGPNPKGHAGEMAIIYGDLVNNIATTYLYHGQNNSNSWVNPAAFIQSDAGALTSTSNSFSLDLDVSAINALLPPNVANDYTGVSFGDKIGIWFHVSTGTNNSGNPFEYDNNGRITNYSVGSQGWYDRGNVTTTSVPEPMTLLLMGVGLLGLAGRRRR